MLKKKKTGRFWAQIQNRTLNTGKDFVEVGPKVSSKICVIINWETSSETTVTSAAYCQKPPGDTFSTSPTKSLNCCYAATAAVEIRTTGTTRRYKEKLHSSTYSALTLFPPLFTVLWVWTPACVLGQDTKCKLLQMASNHLTWQMCSY